MFNKANFYRKIYVFFFSQCEIKNINGENYYFTYTLKQNELGSNGQQKKK